MKNEDDVGDWSGIGTCCRWLGKHPEHWRDVNDPSINKSHACLSDLLPCLEYLSDQGLAGSLG
jgi:hypothetical protein